MQSDELLAGCPPFKVGQIADKLSEWKKLSSDPWLLENVKGVKLPFIETPYQEREPSPYRLSKEEMEFSEIISNVFLRGNKDGGHRLILDLTWLNLHLEYEHFKMRSLQTAKDLMRKECWLGSIDLKDAYYSVPVHVEYRKYLRFRWKGRLMQFKVLPNGLACAPRYFTKILVPAFASLREKGYKCFPYIDDSFIVADGQERCEEAVRELASGCVKWRLGGPYRK